GAAAVVSVLMSFENFNTTLMLVGSDAPLTITMFDRLKLGSTPVLNAVSLLLIVVSAALGLASLLLQKRKD
ncbi:MAG TPA: ABC transporter permease, partial [Roseobacter sp.]|nr:ABC transporter permease [Roseobacter sp.]